MTPLDSLASMLRTRLAYHAEMLVTPGAEQMFHNGCIHGIISALAMLYRVQSGERSGE